MALLTIKAAPEKRNKKKRKKEKKYLYTLHKIIMKLSMPHFKYTIFTFSLCFLLPKYIYFVLYISLKLFFFIGKEKYHRRKNVIKEYTKEAQEAKGETKS